MYRYLHFIYIYQNDVPLYYRRFTLLRHFSDSLYEEFSTAMSRFTHSLVATNMLSDALQVSNFLNHSSLIQFDFNPLFYPISNRTSNLFMQPVPGVLKTNEFLMILCFFQDVLLAQLGVSPSGLEPWPLTVYPRTLAVLAEVLLLRQQKEREIGSIKSQSEASVINIWNRFMAALKNAIIGFDNNVVDFEGRLHTSPNFVSTSVTTNPKFRPLTP